MKYKVSGALAKCAHSFTPGLVAIVYVVPLLACWPAADGFAAMMTVFLGYRDISGVKNGQRMMLPLL